MSWEKKASSAKRKMTFYFNIPKIDDLLQTPEYIIGRSGWTRKMNGSLYMIPSCEPGSEVWVGVRKDYEELVHCITPRFRRIIDMVDGQSVLHFLYDKHAYLPFYRMHLLVRGRHGEPLSELMKLEDIDKYCRDWCDALSNFPQDPHSIAFRAHDLANHLRNQGKVAKKLKVILAAYNNEPILALRKVRSQ